MELGGFEDPYIWRYRLVDNPEGVQGNPTVVFAARWWLVVGAIYVGLLMSKERSDVDIGAYVILLGGFIKLNRANYEQIMFSMYIMYSNSDMTYLDFDVVGFYCVNSRLTLLVDGSRGIRDPKAKVLQDGVAPLDHFGIMIECAYFVVC